MVVLAMLIDRGGHQRRHGQHPRLDHRPPDRRQRAGRLPRGLRARRSADRSTAIEGTGPLTAVRFGQSERVEQEKGPTAGRARRASREITVIDPATYFDVAGLLLGRRRRRERRRPRSAPVGPCSSRTRRRPGRASTEATPCSSRPARAWRPFDGGGHLRDGRHRVRPLRRLARRGALRRGTPPRVPRRRRGRRRSRGHARRTTSTTALRGGGLRPDRRLARVHPGVGLRPAPGLLRPRLRDPRRGGRRRAARAGQHAGGVGAQRAPARSACSGRSGPPRKQVRQPRPRRGDHARHRRLRAGGAARASSSTVGSAAAFTGAIGASIEPTQPWGLLCRSSWSSPLGRRRPRQRCSRPARAGRLEPVAALRFD